MHSYQADTIEQGAGPPVAALRPGTSNTLNVTAAVAAGGELVTFIRLHDFRTIFTQYLVMANKFPLSDPTMNLRDNGWMHGVT